MSMINNEDNWYQRSPKVNSSLPKILNRLSLLTWRSAMSSIIFGPFRLLGNLHLFNWLFRWPVGVDMWCRSCRPEVEIRWHHIPIDRPSWIITVSLCIIWYAVRQQVQSREPTFLGPGVGVWAFLGPESTSPAKSADSTSLEHWCQSLITPVIRFNKKLYYCNMVESFWWDSSLICVDQLVFFSGLTLLIW